MTIVPQSEPLYYHVRFSTWTVGPTSLPQFPYNCVEVGFNTVTYVAVVRAEDFDGAIATITRYWPDASVCRVIRNQREMYENSATHVSRYGFVDHAPSAPQHTWVRSVYNVLTRKKV